MKLSEVKEAVLTKLKNCPQLGYVKENYMVNVVGDAINDVLDFINYHENDELEGTIVTPIADLSIIRLNLTGVEGIENSSKAGASETYSNDIPKSIQRKLRKHRSLI